MVIVSRHELRAMRLAQTCRECSVSVRVRVRRVRVGRVGFRVMVWVRVRVMVRGGVGALLLTPWGLGVFSVDMRCSLGVAPSRSP